MINPSDVEFMPLTKGYTAMVDADMFPELSKRKWAVQINKGGRAYAVKSEGPVENQKHVYMHHLVLPPKPGFTIDHVYAGTPFLVLDERRCNLRYATKLQQTHNKRKTKIGTSRWKGVSWDKSKNRWICGIAANGKRMRGGFVYEEDAARAYDVMARKHFGEFAVLNFPNEKG